jgi:NTE family protein
MTTQHASEPAGDVALVLSGGGARAAYQVGVLRAIARHAPGTRFEILTGVSAGAINAAFLASHAGSLTEAVAALGRLWSGLRVEEVLRTGAGVLVGNVLRWVGRLASGGAAGAPRARSLVDTAPLRELLERTLGGPGPFPDIARNLALGRLRAVALTTLDYSTGRTVSWVEGLGVAPWERATHRAVLAPLTVSHILASAALPLVFPAVPLAGTWHGDGGVRLAAPLAPAVHLGARRILVVSTRCTRACERPPTAPAAYPPPAQIAGLLSDAVFLDLLDQDALRVHRFNEVIARVPPERRGDARIIDLLVLRPSQDLRRLAELYESGLPGSLRFLLRGLGTRESAGSDFLSLLMFDPGYLTRLIDIGEADAERQMDEILALVSPDGPSARGEIAPEAPRSRSRRVAEVGALAGAVCPLDGPRRRSS